MTPDKTVRERWEVPLPHKEEQDDHWDQSEYKQGRFEEVVELKMELIVDWRGLVDDSPVGIIIRVLDSLANEAVDEKGEEEEPEAGGRVVKTDEATVEECEVTDGIPLVWIVVVVENLVVVGLV